jgi:hypothetical protein
MLPFRTNARHRAPKRGHAFCARANLRKQASSKPAAEAIQILPEKLSLIWTSRTRQVSNCGEDAQFPFAVPDIQAMYAAIKAKSPDLERFTENSAMRSDIPTIF